MLKNVKSESTAQYPLFHGVLNTVNILFINLIFRNHENSNMEYCPHLFLTAIRGSYVNAKKMSNFYFTQLNNNSADPDIALLKTNFQPFNTTMNSTYTAFIAQGGNQNGASKTFSQRLADMTPNVNFWDSSVQLIYPKGSGPYAALFPNGHTGFLQGTQIDRITAVEALSLKLGADAAADTANAPALTLLKGKVDLYYTDLEKAYNDKNDGKSISGIQSDACFDASIAVCEQMLIGLGTLTIKFYKTPGVIAGYFDEATIRSSQQTDFSHLVKLLTAFTIAKRTLAPTDQIRINNTGPVLLRFYAGNIKDAAIGTVFIEVAPGANQTYSASALGDVTNNHFIMVYNPDVLQPGSFVLNLL